MAEKTFNTRIKHKRDTHANWTTNNPILLDGEIAIVDNNGTIEFKIGDGSTAYSSLPFYKAPVENTDLTASRALISNSSGKVAVSAVTSTELGYLDGVTSAIQTQLNNKATKGHGIYYGTCDTAADTAAKVVTLTDATGFSLTAGAVVVVKFTNTNSVASPTLNVNSTGAKSIYRYGTTAANTSQSSTGWRAGAVQIFVYDGTGWVRDFWENSTYANTTLGQGYGTCSTAEATTAKVVTLSNYNLVAGGIVVVKFTDAVPASATMNINEKGAKDIYYRGAAIVANVINAGDIATFMYDGTQYQLLSVDHSLGITVSTSAPSGGVNGDIWIQYS